MYLSCWWFCKGFQLYVFEAGLTLKKSHRCFFLVATHKKLQYLGRCGCWVVPGICVVLRQFWAYVCYAHLARPKKTRHTRLSVYQTKKNFRKWEDYVNFGEFNRYFFLQDFTPVGGWKKHCSLLYPHNWGFTIFPVFFHEDGEQKEKSSPKLTWAAQKRYALVWVNC